jgi:hypothetical protein
MAVVAEVPVTPEQPEAPHVPEEPSESLVEDPTLNLSLVEPEETTPGKAAEVFVAQMEEERRKAAELEARLAAASLPLLGESGMVEGLEVPGALEFSRSERPPSLQETEAPQETAPDSSPSSTPRKAPRRRFRRRRLTWLGDGLLLAVVVPIMALAASATLVRGPGSSDDEPGTGPVSLEEAAANVPVRPAPPSDREIRRSAYRGLLVALTDLRGAFDIAEVPSDWLEGWYLASPSSYPEVRSYWDRLLRYADEAYASEVLLYRKAYLEVATAAGISGPVRSLRMAAAVEDFEANRGLREVHYSRVWNLAASALALHDQLVQLEGRITYEPAVGERLSADPVLEAAGTDPEAQARLEVALDRVLSDLRAPDGEGMRDRSLVSSWLVDGLMATAGPAR